MKKTLLIVEDDLALREQLVSFIGKNLGLNILEAGCGAEALALVKVNQIHVILSDVKMPQMDGIKFLESLKQLQIDTPVIFQTGHADKETAIQALKLGAFDFIEKPYKINAVIQSVYAALNVKTGKLSKTLQSLSLTTNQIKVVEALLTGKSNKEIASGLDITEQGVKYHVSALLSRFGAKNRLELKQKIQILIES